MSVPATATPVANQPRKATKRTVRLLHGELQGCPAVIQISTPRKTARYFIEPIANEISDGRAFLMRETSPPDATIYSCIATGEMPTCDCPGHTAHGHCKHVDALAALVAAKKI